MEYSWKFLDRTHQKWKFDLVTFWLPPLGLSISFLVAPIVQDGLAGLALLCGGVALYVAGWAWGALTIRCPTCLAPLYLKARQEHGMFGFTTWMKSLAECPVCGSQGGPNAVAMRPWKPDPPYWTSKRIGILLAALMLLIAAIFVTVEHAKHTLVDAGRARQLSPTK